MRQSIMLEAVEVPRGSAVGYGYGYTIPAGRPCVIVGTAHAMRKLADRIEDGAAVRVSAPRGQVTVTA